MEEWYWRNGGYSRDSSMFSAVIDKTLVCNKNSEEILKNHFKRNKNEVDTVYIGVDEEKFNPEKYSKKEILNKLNIKNDNKYILGYICRISNQKRPYLLLEIIRKLKQKRNDFIVVVAGDGPMLQEIKNKAKSLKIFENMKFLGKCSSTAEIYAISDLTINCSIKEGLALTSYESLSMGVPVVSTDVGGQKELISDDVGKVLKCYQNEKEINDYNYKEEEIVQYVDAIEDILDNLNTYKSNCRKNIVERFTIKNMISRIEKIFEQTVKNPNIQKIENGKSLEECDNLTKEFITSYMMGTIDEYEWLTKEFNLKNVDRDYEFESKHSKYDYYEQTLEYKIKHPIVVVLRKLGIYDFCKKIIGKE